ncbi:MAG: bifunctional adenosylcobinamide kinase/adenosylcobinamide-phosphate guanylyltransferase [Clostridiales bacterium]|jgi:adenosylcobinamide kinase/adenosylcobinamide-phosphate guanylyltransferase|nr:bifunctional adenosylcobinamide kinase/adenosylcobinamide-phosphate guanylyltransferase [Clostridiales bacterium]
MELYIGGFAQGKLEYVQNKKAEEATSIVMVIDCAQSDYQKTLQSIDNKIKNENADVNNIANVNDIVIINHLHLWVKDLLREGMEEASVQSTILSWVATHPNTILICDELGNGIVPLEKMERIWREQTGRLMIELAKQAERVERILCGLGQRLK